MMQDLALPKLADLEIASAVELPRSNPGRDNPMAPNPPIRSHSRRDQWPRSGAVKVEASGMNPC